MKIGDKHSECTVTQLPGVTVQHTNTQATNTQ
jgi:hypothetical protein